ncbi:MAG: hypothetical protein QNK40_12840, partial [Desulfobacterales bacterium]|nr:hypothetical protein [Desulfobacterales bacterium]
MKLFRIISIVFFICFVCNHPIFAATLNVPSEYQTIQEAVDASSNEDTIIVSDGIYTGEGNRDIDFKGKALTVKSLKG